MVYNINILYLHTMVSCNESLIIYYVSHIKDKLSIIINCTQSAINFIQNIIVYIGNMDFFLPKIGFMDIVKNLLFMK